MKKTFKIALAWHASEQELPLPLAVLHSYLESGGEGALALGAVQREGHDEEAHRQTVDEREEIGQP